MLLLWGSTLAALLRHSMRKNSQTHLEKPVTLIIPINQQIRPVFTKHSSSVTLGKAWTSGGSHGLVLLKIRWIIAFKQICHVTHNSPVLFLRELVPDSWEGAWRRIPPQGQFLKLLNNGIYSIMAIIVLTSELTSTCNLLHESATFLKHKRVWKAWGVSTAFG